MEIVRTGAVNRAVKKLGASDANLDRLERAITENPDAGDVIQGLGGACKIRFGMKGKGKSGGGRAIHIVIRVRDAAYLLLAYSKSAQEELTAAQRKVILEFVENFE